MEDKVTQPTEEPKLVHLYQERHFETRKEFVDHFTKETFKHIKLYEALSEESISPEEEPARIQFVRAEAKKLWRKLRKEKQLHGATGLTVAVLQDDLDPGVTLPITTEVKLPVYVVVSRQKILCQTLVFDGPALKILQDGIEKRNLPFNSLICGPYFIRLLWLNNKNHLNCVNCGAECEPNVSKTDPRAFFANCNSEACQNIQDTGYKMWIVCKDCLKCQLIWDDESSVEHLLKENDFVPVQLGPRTAHIVLPDIPFLSLFATAPTPSALVETPTTETQTTPYPDGEALPELSVVPDILPESDCEEEQTDLCPVEDSLQVSSRSEISITCDDISQTNQDPDIYEEGLTNSNAY